MLFAGARAGRGARARRPGGRRRRLRALDLPAGCRRRSTRRCERWTVRFDARTAGTASTLTFEAAGAAGRARRRRAGRARGRDGGLRAALPRTRHRAALGGATREVRLPRPARAQLGRAGLVADRAWRTLDAPGSDDGTGVALSAIRPAGAHRPRRRGAVGGAARPRRQPARRRPAALDDLRRRRPPAPRRARAVGRRGRRRTRGARPARCCAARRSSSARCGCDCAFLRWHMRGPLGRRPLRRPAPRMIQARDLRLRRRADLAAAAGVRRASTTTSTCPLEAYGARDGATACERDGEHPLFALERGEITEREFLARLERGLEACSAATSTLHGFGARADGRAAPQPGAVRLLPRAARERGLRFALLHQQRARVGAAVAGQAADRRAVRGRRRLRVRRHAQARAGDLRADAGAARAAGRGVRVRRRPRAQRRGGARGRHAWRSSSATRLRRSRSWTRCGDGTYAG